MDMLDGLKCQWPNASGVTCLIIEVRDSQTRYFIPARYGTGLRPDGRVAGTPSLGSSGRHSGQENIIKSFPMVLGSWWEKFENGDQGSTQNFVADVVSIVVWPASLFLKSYHIHRNRHLPNRPKGISPSSRNQIHGRICR